MPRLRQPQDGAPVRSTLDLALAILRTDLDALLPWASAASSVADRRHRRDVLERVLLSADPHVVSATQRTRARKLGLSESACGESGLRLPPHAVLVPLVLEPSGVGFVRTMRVSFDASVHDGYERDLDHDAARAVSDALELAASYLGRGTPGRGYSLTTVHPDALSVDGQPIRLAGPSLGAAAFVSAVSLWSERPVLPGTVVTGKLVGSQVREVGALEEKLHAAAHGRPDAARFVVPKASLPRLQALAQGSTGCKLVGVATLDELVDATLEREPKSSSPIRYRVSDLRRESERGWRDFSFHNVREHAERLTVVVPERQVDLRVEVMSVLGAACERLGDPTRGRELLEQAARLARSPDGRKWVPDFPRSRLHQSLSMTYRRLWRFDDALRSANLAVETARSGRLRDELYKSYGCLGLVELARDRPVAARRAFERSIVHVHEHSPASCVRSHGYLIQAFGASGDGSAVRREYALARDHLERFVHADDRRSHDGWLRVSYGGALLRLGRPRPARDVLDAPSVHDAIARAAQPGLLARRYLGLALLACGNEREAQAMLAASPFAYGPFLEPALQFSAHVNVLCEAFGLLPRRALDSDIRGRARAALARFPSYLRTGPLELARLDAERCLDDRAPPAEARVALGKLIALCERIA